MQSLNKNTRQAGQLWRQRPYVTDLVPRSNRRILTLAGAGVACIVGLESLYAAMPWLAHNSTDGRIAAFDLDGEGSLGAFFSSLLLVVASVVALLIHSLQKYEPATGISTHRVWLWAAATWLLMSIDESGSLHEGYKEFMTLVTGTRHYGDGSLWWIGAYGVLLLFVGSTVLWKMRTCRASQVTFAIAGVALACAVVVQLELVMRDRGARSVMVEEGLEMLGFLLLLFAMLIHARFRIRALESSEASEQSNTGPSVFTNLKD